MRIVIVVPTYNEAKNIGPYIEALRTQRAGSSHDIQVLIVDGNSPDGTSQIVKSKQSTADWIHLLVEEKKNGLGAAYILGFKHAMRELNADVIMEMDADFQHDPNDISRFISEIEHGYDYVIGSRFAKGGSIPRDWEFYRKVLSIGGNIFTKIVLGIPQVNDFTTGFKASRVKGFVDSLDLDSIMTKGFAYKIDLLFRMNKLGAKIKELPIHFHVRSEGESKMERNNPLESLKVVIALKIADSKSLLRFLSVGLVGLFTDTTLFNILRIFTGNSELGALLSGLVAIGVTYYLNNFWSFGDRKISGLQKTVQSFVVYYISSLIPIIVRAKIISWSVQYFGDSFLVSNSAFFTGVILGLIWNFTIYSKVIWREKRNA